VLTGWVEPNNGRMIDTLAGVVRVVPEQEAVLLGAQPMFQRRRLSKRLYNNRRPFYRRIKFGKRLFGYRHSFSLEIRNINCPTTKERIGVALYQVQPLPANDERSLAPFAAEIVEPIFDLLANYAEDGYFLTANYCLFIRDVGFPVGPVKEALGDAIAAVFNHYVTQSLGENRTPLPSSVAATDLLAVPRK
ncbi:MAG: hypothetical protein AAF597_14510, partial [Bacteroidota bacterium]